jgi:hypothetical protein
MGGVTKNWAHWKERVVCPERIVYIYEQWVIEPDEYKVEDGICHHWKSE